MSVPAVSNFVLATNNAAFFLPLQSHLAKLEPHFLPEKKTGSGLFALIPRKLADDNLGK